MSSLLLALLLVALVAVTADMMMSLTVVRPFVPTAASGLEDTLFLLAAHDKEFTMV